MGSKGFFSIAIIAAVFFASSVVTSQENDVEEVSPGNETALYANNSPLEIPPDLNLSSFNCSLALGIEQLQSEDLWEDCTPKSIGVCSISMDEFECQLRMRAKILDNFERQLEIRWPQLSEQERIDLTFKLECMLRKQADYLYVFQADLKKIWCFLSDCEKKKFLDSYEDLLKRQSRLLLKFEDFLHKQQMLPEDKKILFLQSFEDLIRRQAILLETFEDFLKAKCYGLEITKVACTCCPQPGDTIYYTYYIINKANYTIRNVAVIDSRLGVVATGLSLDPHEMAILNASSVLNGPCGTVCCNTAMVRGEDPTGFVVYNCSKKVCVQLVCPVVKEDSIKVGLQRSTAIGSEKTKAQNVVNIEKDQRSKCPTCHVNNSSSKIEAGDRSSEAYSSWGSHDKLKSLGPSVGGKMPDFRLPPG